MIKNKTNYRILWLIILLLPSILFFLPKTYFDTGKVKCIFTMITGQSCMGCGLTRACMRIIHLDFKSALEYNPMAFIVLPILIFIYLRFCILKLKEK